MRCTSDAQFAGVCDRVGQGRITVEDEHWLMSRVQPTDKEDDNENFKKGLIYIIVTTNKYREEINNTKLKQLLPTERSYTCFSQDRILNLTDVGTGTEHISATKSGNLPPSLEIRVGAPIIITTNHSKRKYKEDGICNGQKGYIDYIEVSNEDPERVEIIWVVFPRKEIAKFYRFEHRQYRKNLHQFLHEDSTPIFPVKKRFTIRSGNVEFQRCQFALSLAYSIVVHKTQGGTFEGEAIVDFRDGFILHGSFYVAISRVKEGSKLFLRDFKRSYVQSSIEIEESVQEMRKDRPYQFSKFQLDDKVFKLDNSDFRVAYLNINALFVGMHDEIVNTDHNLQQLNLLCLSDTRLDNSEINDNIESRMTNWKVMFRADCQDKSKTHMGLLFLVPQSKFEQSFKRLVFDSPIQIMNESKKNETKIQIVHLRWNSHQLSFVYSCFTPSKKENLEMEAYTRKSDFLIGDINLDASKDSDKRRLSELCGKSKLQHLNQVTTEQGNQLDHILVNKNLKHIVFTDTFFNLASDHKTIVLRISHYANDERSLTTDLDVQIKKGTSEMTNENTSNMKNVIAVEDNDEDITDESLNRNTSINSRLSLLDGTNWLNGTVIDSYCDLLMRESNNCYIFSTLFSQYLFTLRKSYGEVNQWNKSSNIFNERIVLFPLFELSHWFLGVLEFKDKNIYILDPYVPQSKSIRSIKLEHKQRLEKLESEYLQPHFENLTGQSWESLTKNVSMYPEIPKQMDMSSCGIFLLKFAR